MNYWTEQPKMIFRDFKGELVSSIYQIPTRWLDLFIEYLETEIGATTDPTKVPHYSRSGSLTRNLARRFRPPGTMSNGNLFQVVERLEDYLEAVE